MNDNKSYKREFLRAPLNTYLLFEDDGQIYKTLVKNVSEGGMLLWNLPHVPSINIVPVMFDLPQIPILEKLSPERVKEIVIDQLNRDILRARVKTIRKDEEQEEVDQVFSQNIGAQFIQLDQNVREKIKKYVEIFTINIVHLVKQLEISGHNNEQADYIRAIAKICGYNSNLKLSVLHQIVRHDYKSLTWI